jgi:hypothetical protein
MCKWAIKSTAAGNRLPQNENASEVQQANVEERIWKLSDEEEYRMKLRNSTS